MDYIASIKYEYKKHKKTSISHIDATFGRILGIGSKMCVELFSTSLFPLGGSHNPSP